MSPKNKFIDSHVHLDHIARRHPGRIRWLMDHRCGVISWAWCAKPESVADMRVYLNRKRAAIHGLSDRGLCCGYLAGIHPRNITDDMMPDDAVRLVRPHLEDPLCLGIGEIGLEYGSLQEKEILAAQLSLLPELIAAGKKIGLHTPRKNKTAITLTLLAVLEAGYHAGITLSPVKTDWRSLPSLVEKHAGGSDRILCNTDSGTVFYEDLLTAAMAGLLEPETAQKLFHGNAARFFGLEG